MSQIPVLTQRIWGAFNPATNQIVGVQTSGEGVYQNVPNQLLGLTFAAVRTATSAATQSVEVMGHNTVSDGQGGTFAYNPADQTSGCVCIGSSAGTVLTVNTVTSGTVVVGQTLCSSVTGLPLATITSFGTGSGGSGTYNLSTTVNLPAPFTFLIDNNLTILVSADGSRWYLTSVNQTVTGLTAPSGNSALAITTPVYSFGNTTDNPNFTFLGTGHLTVASIANTNIQGTTTNDTAPLGYRGEFESATAGQAPITSTVNSNVVSVSLTAGDWDVQGTCVYVPAATTNYTSLTAGISTTTLVLPANTAAWAGSGQVTGGNQVAIPTPWTRVSIASTTVVYVVQVAQFTVSTMTAGGTIDARRAR